MKEKDREVNMLGFSKCKTCGRRLFLEGEQCSDCKTETFNKEHTFIKGESVRFFDDFEPNQTSGVIINKKAVFGGGIYPWMDILYLVKYTNGAKKWFPAEMLNKDR